MMLVAIVIPELSPSPNSDIHSFAAGAAARAALRKFGRNVPR